jgi:hypothetical protein
MITSRAKLNLRQFNKVLTRSYTVTSSRMSSQNEYGQGASHAQGGSHVPGKVQEAVSLEPL